MKNLTFKSLGTEPLPGILHPNLSECRMHSLTGARREKITGNYRNLPSAKPWHGSASTKLQIHQIYHSAPVAAWLSVSLHHAAPSMSGGRNIKSFTSSTEAVISECATLSKSCRCLSYFLLEFDGNNKRLLLSQQGGLQLAQFPFITIQSKQIKWNC